MGAVCWLASYPKSGNTWLRIFLGYLLYDSAETSDQNEIFELQYQDVQKQWYELAAGKPLSGMSEEQLFRLTPKAQYMLSQDRSDTVFVKTHNLLGVRKWETPFINMDVTAGAFYLLRNPLDIVISARHYFGMRNIDQSIEFLNRDWNEIRGNEKQLGSLIGSWKQNIDFWTKMHPSHLHIIRYEDMLAKPFEIFGAVNKFLGANKSDDIVKRAIEMSSFDRLKAVEQKKGYEDKPDTAEYFFRTGTAGQWRELLSDKQIRKVVEANYEPMKKFGYLPEEYV